MVTPSFLQPGDSIGIVAPARSISAHELNDAVRLYESWGLKVKYGNNLYKKNNQFAGTDRERAGDFQKMLDDDEIKVKKGELVKEDMYTVSIQTNFKKITIGKCVLVEMSEI
ncbi:MAG: LD-carboxypeptidase [Bacteroidota bacterium]